MALPACGGAELFVHARRRTSYSRPGRDLILRWEGERGGILTAGLQFARDVNDAWEPVRGRDEGLYVCGFLEWNFNEE